VMILRGRVISNPEYCFIHELPKLQLSFNLARIFTQSESPHDKS
jgi:hypothetical protein